MLNMGGPETLNDVYPFLLRLFSDKEIFALPFQRLLAPWVAKRRTPYLKERYEEVGGGSPLGRWTICQGKALVRILDTISPESAPHKFYPGYRYVHPLTEEAINSIERIRNELAQMPDLKDPQDAVVLFSAHSIPLSIVNRGDPYIQEVGATVHAVMQELEFALPYRLVWQSKVGPAPWMGQDTESAIRGLANLGRKHAILVPITFTSDHIETLHDMDIQFCAKIAKEAGMINVRRAAAPNDNAMFVQGLAELVHTHLRKGEVSSRQFFLRCPSCTNDRCSKARLFLAGEADRVADWTNAQSFRLPSGVKATYKKVPASI
ncbi:unnamed protein product [Dibothriocephalus latus]|uniref:Ferrochelatase n=1 Tax=Dibothriocephalus latus TaxID=60516 RepID=A0A3P7LDZ1_DIBLA|nr:unnamed protein product [Dibothriocephalus latus]